MWWVCVLICEFFCFRVCVCVCVCSVTTTTIITTTTTAVAVVVAAAAAACVAGDMTALEGAAAEVLVWFAGVKETHTA